MGEVQFLQNSAVLGSAWRDAHGAPGRPRSRLGQLAPSDGPIRLREGRNKGLRISTSELHDETGVLIAGEWQIEFKDGRRVPANSFSSPSQLSRYSTARHFAHRARFRCSTSDEGRNAPPPLLD